MPMSDGMMSSQQSANVYRGLFAMFAFYVARWPKTACLFLSSFCPISAGGTSSLKKTFFFATIAHSWTFRAPVDITSQHVPPTFSSAVQFSTFLKPCSHPTTSCCFSALPQPLYCFFLLPYFGAMPTSALIGCSAFNKSEALSTNAPSTAIHRTLSWCWKSH